MRETADAYQIYSGFEWMRPLGDLGVDNIRIVSKLFQPFVGHIYRVRTSADAEDHTESYAVF